MRKVLVWLAVLLWGSASACSASLDSAVERPSIDQLLIDESAFPGGREATKPNWEHPPRAPWSGRTKMIEYIDRRFYTRSGNGATALIRLRQFDGLRSAAGEYERRVDTTFRDTEGYTPWDPPAGLSFQSALADQYRYACSTEGVGELARPVCAYVAQYEVYVVDFRVDIGDSTVITYTDLLPIFQAIDERIAVALQDTASCDRTISVSDCPIAGQQTAARKLESQAETE